ncbi:ceramide transfer protein-like isoform X2 [Macrosteles quadrilineatus]|uniref:ceramide transfer protein-like isoform X2 n=1 Tax=Macrosteles quadrilineatus TaxID=74068 RepID=UPI0023E30E8F|nr:ceramide transfer protein-like isoform X2 [Macrosteles quadrilineatus]XP_054289956.1 ceramide transfer protein-like isoform X2 [Macrosteles quadrilineatus]
MADGHVSNGSDEEDDSENNCYQYELKGFLSKWTNYIHGWQRRYIVLKDGTLSYYKSEQETGFGCRGAISLFKATIKPHEFDECRFDVSVNDCVWYLRAESAEDRQYWIDILEAFKVESGYGSENSLKRHGSAISLASNTISTASASRGLVLKEKLAEMETYKDILCNQMKTLQGYFDTCADSTGNKPQGENELVKAAVDFRGEALTFRETTAAMLSNLQQCLDAVGQRDDVWRKRLEREVDKRKQLEQALLGTRKHPSLGPDLEEGPHNTLNEDEFYDAVETGLDKLEEEAMLRERLKQPNIPRQSLTARPNQHRLWPQVIQVTGEQIHYAKLGVGEVEKGGWQLFAEEGEMKMYRREEEVNGLVVDPLKACHVVKGVTGREMCHYFFSPQYRHEWESTVEQMTVVETIREDTLVFHQVHKRVWPTSQRDALFWSHMTRVPDPQDRDAGDIWVVVNNSLSDKENKDYQGQVKSSSKYVRIHLTVCMLCQTIITPPADGASVTRDNITCKITYCSQVNPGGWVPASALRAVYKREYPKFLKRFTGYVIGQTQDKPIMF